MNTNGSAGGTGSVKLEQYYPGMDDKHTLNSNGEFVHRTVRKLENTVNKLRSSREKQAHKVQDATQTSVYDRRVQLLQKHGNFQAAADSLNRENPNDRGGELSVIVDDSLETDITGIKSIATDALAGKPAGANPAGANPAGANKVVVSEDGLLRRSQKDLTIYLRQCIDLSKTPHTLHTLNHYVNLEAQNGGIRPEQATELRRAIRQESQHMARNLTKTLMTVQPASSSPADIYAAETTKLQFIHDLTTMLHSVAPEVLQNHKGTFRKAAVKAYIAGTNPLDPHPSRFKETQKMLDDVAGNRDDLLKPVLGMVSDQKTAKKAMDKAVNETALTLKVLQNQLDEVAKRSSGMQKAINQLEERQKELSQLTHELKAAVRDLDATEAKYQQLKNEAGSRLKRRFNLSYQWERRANRLEQKAKQKKVRLVQRSITHKQEQIREEKRVYTYHKMELRTLHKKFSDCMEVIKDSPTNPRAGIGTARHDKMLLELASRDLIEEPDLLAAHQHFSRLIRTGIPEDAITEMTTKYRQLIEEQQYDSQQALWIISNSYSSAAASNFEDKCVRETEFLTQHAELKPARNAVPQKTAKSPEEAIPVSLQLQAHLDKLNPTDNAGYSNTGVAGYIYGITEDYPELIPRVNQVCRFFLDGLENDGTAFANDPKGFNELFIDHYTALGVGIRALTEEQASGGDACKRMEEYLNAREAELGGFGSSDSSESSV